MIVSVASYILNLWQCTVWCGVVVIYCALIAYEVMIVMTTSFAFDTEKHCISSHCCDNMTRHS